MHTHIHINATYLHKYIGIHIHGERQACIHTHTYINPCSHTCIHIHIYMQSYTHAYRYTYTYTAILKCTHRNMRAYATHTQGYTVNTYRQAYRISIQAFVHAYIHVVHTYNNTHIL